MPDPHLHCEVYTRCGQAEEASPRSPEHQESGTIIETIAPEDSDSSDARGPANEEDSHVSSSAGRAVADNAMVSEAAAQGHEAEVSHRLAEHSVPLAGVPCSPTATVFKQTEAREAVGDVTNMHADKEPHTDLDSSKSTHKSGIVADVVTFFQHRAFGNLERVSGISRPQRTVDSPDHRAHSNTPKSTAQTARTTVLVYPTRTSTIPLLRNAMSTPAATTVTPSFLPMLPNLDTHRYAAVAKFREKLESVREA